MEHGFSLGESAQGRSEPDWLSTVLEAARSPGILTIVAGQASSFGTTKARSFRKCPEGWQP
jgi:hypothetical protein